jgi:hypothetical protein
VGQLDSCDCLFNKANLTEYDRFSIVFCKFHIMPFDHVAYALPQEIVERAVNAELVAARTG